MVQRGKRTETLWRDTVQLPQHDRLRTAADVDVCVVGAGIAGITTAYLLAREGKRVLVVDDGEVAGGETGNTTAHLTAAFDDLYQEVEKMFDAKAARVVAESHSAAISLIGEIAQQESIDCDYRRLDGYLFPGDYGGPDAIREEERAARAAGLDVALTEDPPYNPFRATPALRFAGQATFHPLRWLTGVVRAFEARGGRICTNTKVTSVVGGSPVRIETAGGVHITAKACVVATNAAITDMVQTHAKSAPYRTFVVVLKVPAGSVPDALYWDNSDPYIYVRLHRGEGHDYLIVGGEDYKTGQADDDEERLQRLESWTRERFPMAGELTHRWSGQVVEPDDYVAFIGPNPDGAENVFIIMGDSGQGMTHGVLGAILLNDLVQGRSNAWSQLYDPRRITAGAAAEYVKQNLNVVAQFADYLRPGEVRSVEEVPRNSGRLLRKGTAIHAVYRDEDGFIHERSAKCTHMKCIVQWNDLEKSWDCPCHGSRFSPLGEVLNGPAVSELDLVD